MVGCCMDSCFNPVNQFIVSVFGIVIQRQGKKIRTYQVATRQFGSISDRKYVQPILSASCEFQVRANYR